MARGGFLVAFINFIKHLVTSNYLLLGWCVVGVDYSIKLDVVNEDKLNKSKMQCYDYLIQLFQTILFQDKKEIDGVVNEQGKLLD